MSKTIWTKATLKQDETEYCNRTEMASTGKLMFPKEGNSPEIQNKVKA